MYQIQRTLGGTGKAADGMVELRPHGCKGGRPLGSWVLVETAGCSAPKVAKGSASQGPRALRSEPSVPEPIRMPMVTRRPTTDVAAGSVPTLYIRESKVSIEAAA